MFSLFQYQFIQRSLIVGTLVAIIAPIVGIFLVVKRFSALSDTLAHTSLVGVVLGIIFKTNPILAAIVSSILAAISIETIRNIQKKYSESVLTLFLTGGLGISSILISLNRGTRINIESYLFGNINTITMTDIWITFVVSVAILFGIGLMYKQLFLISLDEEIALSQGIKTQQINFIFIILASLVVAVSIQTVGILLISSLMILPVLTSMKFKNGFFITMLLSAGVAIVSVWSGIICSYYFNIATGGSIVVINLLFYGLSSMFTSNLKVLIRRNKV